MRQREVEPPPELLAHVAGDLTPVRPIGAARRRVALWAPAAVLVFLVVPLAAGLRADAGRLGPLLTWGASILQLGLGIWLIWAGVRESRPGQRLPLRAGASMLAAGILVVASLTAITFAVSPTTLGAAVAPWRADAFCFGSHLGLGVPLLFLAALLAGRALPGQPWLAGALFGGGAGLTADGSWRLVCPVSDPWHVMAAHGGAVAVLAAAGAVAAYVAARLATTGRARR